MEFGIYLGSKNELFQYKTIPQPILNTANVTDRYVTLILFFENCEIETEK